MTPTTSLLEQAEYVSKKGEEYTELGDRSFEEMQKALRGLAMVVSEMESKELWKPLGYSSFPDYYENKLNREKSTISRLRAAGDEFIAAGFSVDNVPTGNFSYKLIPKLRSMNPNMDPKLLVATAQTWTKQDVKDEVKEKCKNPDFHEVCVSCWATKEKHAH